MIVDFDMLYTPEEYEKLYNIPAPFVRITREYFGSVTPMLVYYGLMFALFYFVMVFICVFLSRRLLSRFFLR